MLFGVDEEQIKEDLKRTTKRESVLDGYIEIVDLMAEHFRDVRPSFVHAVERRFYPAGRDLLIPLRLQFFMVTREVPFFLGSAIGVETLCRANAFRCLSLWSTKC